MAKTKGLLDNQVQRVFVELNMTAANAETYAKIPFSATVHTPNSQAVEIVDVLLEWVSSAQQRDWSGNGGQWYVALAMAPDPPGGNIISEWSVFGKITQTVQREGAGPTAESSHWVEHQPMKMVLPPKDLDGRGVILAPDNLYLIADTENMTLAGGWHACIYYRTHEIDTTLALEMLQMINALQ